MDDKRTPKPLQHSPVALMWAMRVTGWTQYKLAEEVGIRASHLNEMVHGKRNINDRLLLDLARAIGCPVSVLYAKPHAVSVQPAPVDQQFRDAA